MGIGPATEALLRQALGEAAHEAADLTPGGEPPARLVFDDVRRYSNFSETTQPVRDEAAVAAQIVEGWSWCAARFPLRLPGADGGLAVRSIKALVVRHSPRADELLSASSIQAPGVVLLAADWPLSQTYRLASVLAHESLHQLLFRRERADSPVRPGALGYSPWREALRDGRLVWHAFWTFAGQFTLLGEALADAADLRRADPGMPGYLADMKARVDLCAQSLVEFDVVEPDELARCAAGLGVAGGVAERLARSRDFADAAGAAEQTVRAEFDAWAAGFAESRGAGASVSAAG